MEIAVLALGCFWGPEIKFDKLEGVTKTEVGYCGGNSETTTYEKVCSGNTNHAEVVKIGAANEILTTVAKGKFLNAVNMAKRAIKPKKHLKKCKPGLFV